MVSESRVTWATSAPILHDLSILDLGTMYATDRQTSDVRRASRLMPPPYGDGGIIIQYNTRDTTQPAYTCRNTARERTNCALIDCID